MTYPAKKYKLSRLMRLFSLGCRKYGFKLDRGVLTQYGNIRKDMLIHEIESMDYGLIAVRTSDYAVPSYAYLLKERSGIVHQLAYSQLEGSTYQKMLRDIIAENPQIQLSHEMQEFLESDIPRKSLQFDFSVNFNGYFNRDKELGQKYPSLDAFVGFSIILLFLFFPALFYWIGEKTLLDRYGIERNHYRIWAISLAGFSLSIAAINLFISLVSMYLGHKVTIVAICIFILGIIVAYA